MVSIIVVTHDSEKEIGDCLESLRVHTPAVSHEVIVVDNASEDDTVAVVRRHADVRLSVAPARRGFSANCNAGAHEARGRILLLLNPDTRVRPEAIDTLVAFLDAHPAVAVVGPRLVYPDGSVQPSARRFPQFVTTVVRRTPLRMVFPHSAAERRHLMLDDQRDDARTVDWLLGACLAVPAEVYRQLGGMDERYRLYCEDIDLCWRTWAAGYQVAIDPQAVVEHDLSELTRRRFLTRATLWHFSSMGRFVLRHGLRRSPARPSVDL